MEPIVEARPVARQEQRRRVRKTALLVVGGLMLLSAGTAVVAALTRNLSWKSLPASEQLFCAVLESASLEYQQDTNGIRLAELRPARARGLRQVPMNVEGWVGKIYSIEAGPNGGAKITVSLPCELYPPAEGQRAVARVRLESRTVDSITPAGTQPFSAARRLSDGDKVTFDGQLHPNDRDGFEELSITEHGSFEEPEFVFRYARLERL